jgi:hypothetical protein
MMTSKSDYKIVLLCQHKNNTEQLISTIEHITQNIMNFTFEIMEDLILVKFIVYTTEEIVKGHLDLISSIFRKYNDLHIDVYKDNSVLY